MNNRDPWETFKLALARGREGEIRRTFEELYTSVKDEMVRFARWCARQHNPDLVPGHVLDPADVVEDTLTDLFLKYRTIKKDPKAWLLGNIRRRLKHRVARSRNEDKNKPDAQRHLDYLQQSGPVASSVPRERRRRIRQAVKSLPDRMRQVIIALFYCNYSVEATAAKLGITRNSVIKTKLRAIKKLEGLIAR